MAKKPGQRRWFSITADDCEFIAKRGSGKGGQKRNKTSNAIQCFHRPSGAMGEAEDGRSQLQNKQLAFERMAKSPQFQSWLNLRIDAGYGKVEIEESDGSGGWSPSRELRMDELDHEDG